MISYFQGGILGLLQGISELFPVSSLGHSIILTKLLHWQIDTRAPYFLTFLVATHFATAIVLFLYFWRDWMRILKGLFRSLRIREVRDDDPDAKLGWLLIIGTIPAGILGLLLEDVIRSIFITATSAAFFLILNGILLFGAEILRRNRKEQVSLKKSDERIAGLSFGKAMVIGTVQALALIPGFSRTGASLTGGLLFGLSHEDAARYSFLLATPIIGAAALLKLPDLAGGSSRAILGPTLTGAFLAGAAAYFSVKFLTEYFETNKLTPFALYCLITGILTSLLFQS